MSGCGIDWAGWSICNALEFYSKEVRLKSRQGHRPHKFSVVFFSPSRQMSEYLDKAMIVPFKITPSSQIILPLNIIQFGNWQRREINFNKYITRNILTSDLLKKDSVLWTWFEGKHNCFHTIHRTKRMVQKTKCMYMCIRILVYVYLIMRDGARDCLQPTLIRTSSTLRVPLWH